MLRWLVALIYCPLVPLALAGALGDPQWARLTGVASLISGLVVCSFHLKQPSWKGRAGVFVGYLFGSGLAISMWFMGLLSMAFLSDSGQHKSQLLLAMQVFTVALALFVPPMGAGLGALIARPRQVRNSA